MQGLSFERWVLLAAAVATVGCASLTGHGVSPPREWFREGAGRTVVMLGGGVYGARMFAPHAEDLSNAFDVIRVQTLNVQLAANGAPMPSSYSVETEAEKAVEPTLATLGVKGPVDLVGASFGAGFHRHMVDRLAPLLPHVERAELPGDTRRHARPSPSSMSGFGASSRNIRKWSYAVFSCNSLSLMVRSRPFVGKHTEQSQDRARAIVRRERR